MPHRGYLKRPLHSPASQGLPERQRGVGTGGRKGKAKGNSQRGRTAEVTASCRPSTLGRKVRPTESTA